MARFTVTPQASSRGRNGYFKAAEVAVLHNAHDDIAIDARSEKRSKEPPISLSISPADARHLAHCLLSIIGEPITCDCTSATVGVPA